MKEAIIESFNRLILAIEDGCDLNNFYILLIDLRNECFKLHSCKEYHILPRLPGIINIKISVDEEIINQSIEELIIGLYDSFIMDCKTFGTKITKLEKFLVCKQRISMDRIQRRQNILN